MIMIVTAIKDSKAGFLAPAVYQNRAMAVRDFQYLVRDGSGVMGEYYDDFNLYQIGEFDTESGHLISTGPPEFLAAAERNE